MNQRVLGQRHPASGHGVADLHAFIFRVGLIRPFGEVQHFTALTYVFGYDPRNGCDAAIPWPVRAARVAVLA